MICALAGIRFGFKMVESYLCVLFPPPPDKNGLEEPHPR
jgi:hypothetical protein